jgi:hypothetical protein
MRAAVLQGFCEKIISDPEQNKGVETLDEWLWAKNISASQVKASFLADYENLVNNFAESLNLSVNHASGINLLQIVEGNPNGSLSDSVARINSQSNAAELNVEISINKNKLLEIIGGVTVAQAKYYLFKENLLQIINKPLLQLDALLFASQSTPRLIIISEDCPAFDGDLLNIVTETNYPAFNQSKLLLNADKLARLERFYGDSLSKPSWMGFDFTNLTPLHFFGKWQGTDSENLAKITNAQLQKLCVLFTANRCNLTAENSFQAIYANSDRVVYLELSDSATVKSDKTLKEIVEWISEGNHKDKLTVFQNVTARLLNNSTPAKNYESLADSLPKIFEEAEWNYKLFVDGKITKHFEEVQKFSSSVADTAKKVAENIDTVNKGITDALLATIGVLIATVLAALVKNEATSEIFSISFTAYAIYLLVYALYRMGSIGHSYYLLSTEANEQKTLYTNTIGAEKVKELTKPIKRRRIQFHIWFWVTVLIYVILAVGIWLAATRLPAYLINNQIIKPKATPTPTPSPESANVQQNTSLTTNQSENKSQ